MTFMAGAILIGNEEEERVAQLERRIAYLVVGSVLAAALWLGLSAPTKAQPATPLDPVSAIVAAFGDHDIVALGEGNHGNLPGHTLRLQLIRDDSFRDTVNDIVVEFGNSRYQSTIDQYIAGEFVAIEELRKVWEDTAQANPVWDTPIYEEFFRAVRELNMSAPDDRRLRVVLGDVPFDWSAVRTLADYNRQPQRNDAASAAIIRREVLAKDRKALVIFGDLHFPRKPVVLEPRDPQDEHSHTISGDRSIVAHLEAAGAKVFSIYSNTFADLGSIQYDAAGWSTPSLALLANTALGERPFGTFQPVATLVDGRWMKNDDLHSPSMAEQFDAVLFLGPPAAIRYAPPSPALCSDRAYLEKRFFRMELVGLGAQAEQAKQYCRMIAGATNP